MTPDKLRTIAANIVSTAAALRGQQQSFLADLIAIRSYTGQEGPAVERTLQELRAIGCDDVWMDTAGNALGRIGNGRRVILYDAHLDTNEVADEREWPHPPLQPTVENGAMWGLGASDCKGGVAAIVYGAAILKALKLSGDFTLLVMGATLEEDAEGFALRSLVERDGVRPDAVLLAEATDLTLRRGQRGRCEVRVRTTGKAVHASTPQIGENAILKMMPVIAALEAMNRDLPTHPIFGKGTQVVSMIEGPHTPNSVPSWCEVTVDRRMMPGESMASVLDGIRAVVEPLGAMAHIPDQPVLTHTGQRLDGPSFYPGWLLDEQRRWWSPARSLAPPCGAKHPASMSGALARMEPTRPAPRASLPWASGHRRRSYVHAADDQSRSRKAGRGCCVLCALSSHLHLPGVTTDMQTHNCSAKISLPPRIGRATSWNRR